METPDPPSDPEKGLQTGGNLTPHDIPKILRVYGMCFFVLDKFTPNEYPLKINGWSR